MQMYGIKGTNIIPGEFCFFSYFMQLFRGLVIFGIGGTKNQKYPPAIPDETNTPSSIHVPINGYSVLQSGYDP